MITKNQINRGFKFSLLITCVTLTLGSVIFLGYPWYKAHNSFVATSYRFKIEAIDYRPGHRGVPYIKMDTGWYLFRGNSELYLIPVIQVGDSLVKEKGKERVKLFRKDGHGKWNLEEVDYD